MGHTYLRVPFTEKEEAKRLGARWDPDKRLWYAPERMNPTPFLRWIPPEQEDQEPRLASLIHCGAYLFGQFQDTCWACKKTTALWSFLLPPALMSVTTPDGPNIRQEAIALSRRLRPPSQPSDSDWQYIEGYHVPIFLNFITTQMKTAVASLTPHYRPASSKTTGSSYWMNHCQHCGAKQGDFRIREKYNRAAFLMNEHILEEFVLSRGAGPFIALCDSLHGVGVLD